MNTKEDLLFQRMRKEYTRMSKGRGSYYNAWRIAFEERVQKLRDVTFSDERLFSIYDVQTNLRRALTNLVPDKIDDWYKSYTKRITQTKNTDYSTLFTILIIIYLMILDCKPHLNKAERFIIVFDNIETYDNGRAAQKIENFAEICYRYARSIFLELGIIDNFYSKFTLVIVLRTSTLIPFGNMQTEMWAGNQFVKQIKYFDFTEEALLKKLKFLEKIPNYKETLLFKRLYAIASIMLPTQKIDAYLKTEELIDFHYKYFTSQRILPLFNNDYRKTMHNIYSSIINEDRNPTIYSLIMELSGRDGADYDYSVNGIRMALIRDVFNSLKIHEYFDKIGFSDLSGVEEYSITRMILGYLYWDEVNHIACGYKTPYIGAELSKIASTFNYFCGYDNLVKILYGLSVYCNENYKKGAALHEWGNLIIFNDLNVDLTEDEFQNAIKQYLTTGTVEVKIGDILINLKRVNIHLSDAGMCFTQYYIRSFEFLMSRSMHSLNYPSLFLMNDSNHIIEGLENIYEIINNCIKKLIGGCEHVCVLYGKEKKSVPIAGNQMGIVWIYCRVPFS